LQLNTYFTYYPTYSTDYAPGLSAKACRGMRTLPTVPRTLPVIPRTVPTNQKRILISSKES
jgi:hypothetical protein